MLQSTKSRNHCFVCSRVIGEKSLFSWFGRFPISLTTTQRKKAFKIPRAEPLAWLPYAQLLILEQNVMVGKNVLRLTVNQRPSDVTSGFNFREIQWQRPSRRPIVDRIKRLASLTEKGRSAQVHTREGNSPLSLPHTRSKVVSYLKEKVHFVLSKY